MRLNDSGVGEEGVTRVVEDGATHFSRGQKTCRHAHCAWKIHVGLDAPVWLDKRADSDRDGPRVLVVPPNVSHATGAVGWSMALFVGPGSRGASWGVGAEPSAIGGKRAAMIVDAVRKFNPNDREATPELLDEIACLAIDSSSERPDKRVEALLEALERNPEHNLAELADRLGLSLDRLSRLASTQTGIGLRRHRLWFRLLQAFPIIASSRTLAEAAARAGFADHAHMTRTYRSFLGRAPSEFTRPPDVLCPW